MAEYQTPIKTYTYDFPGDDARYFAFQEISDLNGTKPYRIAKYVGVRESHVQLGTVWRKPRGATPFSFQIVDAGEIKVGCAASLKQAVEWLRRSSPVVAESA